MKDVPIHKPRILDKLWHDACCDLCHNDPMLQCTLIVVASPLRNFSVRHVPRGGLATASSCIDKKFIVTARRQWGDTVQKCPMHVDEMVVTVQP